ncbi:CIA30 family protein [Colwellia psychrerythraea]|uniref:NADH:ubiquinone oxidoreductase complex I intermediate-associated protein 30 n=1 Tax=Colwellia psychrerythraea TaxID=28229 RepID=A0A099KFR1_COLPS|nr:CIA30 family protein [Colwellia psychrerythraea]KGJ88463.1 NADH:ubiquinone oxidoreductase complex I intermediate-associated protein 30 [Colwellia psychrerythraea]
MINFIEQQSVENWRITDDGVMGGKSKGRFVFKQGTGTFLGKISLDNNGGFSSVFTEIEPLVQGIKTVTIDLEGDGLIYQLRMVVNFNGFRLSYKHIVKTVAGQRGKFTFTLADFQASFRGRLIDNAPVLKSEDIREVGFLVTRKTTGAFSLSVFSLSF